MWRLFQLKVKRIIDLVLCSFLFILCLPLFILIALLVKSTSQGPVFFMQDRIGKNEKTYRMIKFRTMTGVPDKNAKRWSKAEEDRITPLGHFLRDYGLDELPQLLNIIKGEMSIVGPRSPLPQQVATFSAHFKKMFRMRPGVLSIAAIAGRRSLSMEERYELHVRYVETWSLKLDVKILWKSLFVVLRRESATENLPKE